jgi:hypothetical protein
MPVPLTQRSREIPERWRMCVCSRLVAAAETRQHNSVVLPAEPVRPRTRAPRKATAPERSIRVTRLLAEIAWKCRGALLGLRPVDAVQNAPEPSQHSRLNRRNMFSAGPSLKFRPEPATHQRAMRARRGALRRTGLWGPAFCYGRAESYSAEPDWSAIRRSMPRSVTIGRMASGTASASGSISPPPFRRRRRRGRGAVRQRPIR